MMGDTKKRSRITASTITFNPHPHVEGDEGLGSTDTFTSISIHTLA